MLVERLRAEVKWNQIEKLLVEKVGQTVRINSTCFLLVPSLASVGGSSSPTLKFYGFSGLHSTTTFPKYWLVLTIL